MNISTLDIVIIVGYLVGITTLGIFVGYRKNTTPSQLFLAGRYLGILVTQRSWDGSSKGGSGSNIRRVLLKCAVILMAIPDASC